MQKLKQCATQGLVEIAKLDANNKPVNVPFSQIQSQVSRTQKNTATLKFLSNLDWNQRFQWTNLKRLKAKQMYQSNEIDTALQIYLESLLGIDLNQKQQSLLGKAKKELQYPILLNIATCLYKKSQYKRAIMICDTILKENDTNLSAIYKKSFLLNKCGDSNEACQLLRKGIELSKRIGEEDHLKNFIQLFGQIKASSKQDKSFYTKMFSSEAETEDSEARDKQQSKLLGSENVKLKSNNNNNTNEDGESEILFYEDDPVSICEKLGKFFKNIFRIVVPGSNVSKFKKVLRSTKSL